jgi:arsenate reductase
MKVKIYHNFRCSKSRQTLEILKKNNCDIEIIEYLKLPPTFQELEDILGKL